MSGIDGKVGLSAKLHVELIKGPNHPLTTLEKIKAYIKNKTSQCKDAPIYER